MKYILFFLFIFPALTSIASEKEHDEDHLHEHSEITHKDDAHDHEGEGKAIGHGKAIESFDEKRGFTLSREAQERLEIKTKPILSKIIWLKKSALVRSKKMTGVYIKRERFYKLVHAKIIEVKGEKLKLKLEDFKSSDEVLINGVNLVRVTDIFTKDKSEYGHSH